MPTPPRAVRTRCNMTTNIVQRGEMGQGGKWDGIKDNLGENSLNEKLQEFRFKVGVIRKLGAFCIRNDLL